MTRRVWTIGHSTREFADVLEMLREHRITCLVDVRSYPASRTFPQWNKASIIEELPADIGYRWIPKLGGRRHTPAATPSVNTAWRIRAFRDYADYMQSPDFAEGLGELLEISRDRRPVIMCSEAVPRRCHRRLITDAWIVAGVEVTHIMSRTTTRQASVNPDAVFEDGKLIYPMRR